MYSSPSVSPTSYTVATRGWTSAAADRASRRNRARRCGSDRFVSRSTFNATGRPSCSSSARYTIPIPARPSSPRTTNRPSRLPLTRAASGASTIDPPSMRAISRSSESSESSEGSSSTSSRPPETIEPRSKISRSFARSFSSEGAVAARRGVGRPAAVRAAGEICARFARPEHPPSGALSVSSVSSDVRTRARRADRARSTAGCTAASRCPRPRREPRSRSAG